MINIITSDKDLWWRVKVLGLRIQQSSSICFLLSEVSLADVQLLNEGIPLKQDICVHKWNIITQCHKVTGHALYLYLLVY